MHNNRQHNKPRKMWKSPSKWSESPGEWHEIPGKWREIPGKCRWIPGIPGLTLLVMVKFCSSDMSQEVLQIPLKYQRTNPYNQFEYRKSKQLKVPFKKELVPVPVPSQKLELVPPPVPCLRKGTSSSSSSFPSSFWGNPWSSTAGLHEANKCTCRGNVIIWAGLPLEFMSEITDSASGGYLL